jgi:hypothetical protein
MLLRDFVSGGIKISFILSRMVSPKDRSIHLMATGSSNSLRLHSGSQKTGHTRPVIAGIGLKSRNIRAASTRLPFLILLRNEGIFV